MQEEGTFHFRYADGMHLELRSEALVKFRAENFHPALAKRVSRCFLMEIIALEYRYGLADSILMAVEDLENGTNRSSTKPAEPFKHEPLRGLWHKHYFDARFTAHNIAAALTKKQRRARAYEVFEGQTVFTEELAQKALKEVWMDPFDQRLMDGNATGEWIVYLPRHGKNYYLACAKHSERGQDATLLAEIMVLCPKDFPDLWLWIEEARRANV